MKFSNGFWLNREGVASFSPEEVYSTSVKGNVITLNTPTHKINHRGDTLQGPNITIKISSPIPDVIRVQSFHYMGIVDRGPKFEINNCTDTKFDIVEDETTIKLTSGNLNVKIDKKKWKMEFLNKEERLTYSGWRDLSYVKENFRGIAYDKGALEDTYMREQLNLSVGELIYGLGERFTPFVKNGQTVETWNEDGGTSGEQSYKSIPFYISNKGYGVFVNSSDKVSFEVGTDKVTKVQFAVPGESLDYFIINGPSMKEVLERYTTLTGKPALPPAWSFGLWLTTSFTTNYDEETVTSFVDGMAERDLPLHVFHFDCFWMKDFNWTDLEWDSRVFPDPEGMLKRLKEKGLRICVWINPYIAQESSMFQEGMDNGYLIKRPNGDVWQWDMWQPGMAIVDFTNPAACRWFADKLEALLDMGVDCFKTDFGERIPTEVTYFDGSDPVKMHNYYTYLYNKVVFDVLEKKRGKDEAVLFARSATVGGQQFPVHWGGDCSANYESMAESLRGGLSLTMSGFGFWSHDIGGFESTSTEDVYKRWAAFGLLSSHSRLHGSSSYRVPWLYGEEAVDVVRHFTKLKASLMPYIFNEAYKTSKTGIPSMRSMVLEFQDDPAIGYLDRQYMFGDSILVAPIFNEQGVANYYLPKGTWTNFFTGEKVDGGSWRKETHDYMSIPLMVRPNSIIAVGSENRKSDYDFAQDVTLKVYELEEGKGASATVRSMNSEVALEVSAMLSKGEITIDAKGVGKPWSLVLVGVQNVEVVEGGSFVIEGSDTKIFPSSNVGKLVIKLK
ncbi:alpha-xylosidase [Clostridium cellulovorans]|uniref:alpha-D-xyloside xylohydrolase n=2 Tax=Clostridium cellulovorans TaxID=1493 RepID=D9SMN8_CLOC7|nr:alpha-xylosidase [Clostridium cellulovorans]ADL49823.1 glycoside hydrolase family 31 [Clostridium cellulovorans 743B]BAV13111.1 alpha-xylosidase [Clostridium cellulovorans]